MGPNLTMLDRVIMSAYDSVATNRLDVADYEGLLRTGVCMTRGPST